ncbi:hypothetical protein PQX77_015628 [Marasmius sp. AFHP31]|nr:hypothetical protein PQX77_015628 [Marasmius sp. AFHP31]
MSTTESFLENRNHSPENLQRLFRHPVSKDHKAEITQYLTDTQRSYDKCQLEINKYKALILMLESKRERIKKSMERYQSLLSPVHLLPSELLLEVFGHLCEVNLLDHAKIPPASCLSMVCGRWREIALTSPRLWSSMSFQVDRSESRRDEVVANLTRLFLKRSRKALLKLRIQFRWHPEERYTDRMVLGLLEEQSERWEELKVYDRETYASSRLGGDLYLPNLKHLSFYTNTPDSPESSLPLDRFKHCPALASFHTDVASTEDRLELPWANIRVLKLEDCPDVAALHVLELCTSIEHLTVGETYPRGRLAEDMAVRSETVRTLTINGENFESPPVLGRITLPHLSSIIIEHAYIPHLTLEEFIQRSSCSITSIRLDDFWLTDRQLLSLLHLMACLRTLDVGHSKLCNAVTRGFLEHLTVDPDNPRGRFLPHLTELKLEVLVKELDGQTLLNALTSRWLPGDDLHASTVSGVDRLESVDVILRWNGPPTPDIFSSLQCLKDVSMRVTVSHLTSERSRTIASSFPGRH